VCVENDGMNWKGELASKMARFKRYRYGERD
jgi:hypothetical protein